jgi:hypothetical protein
MFHMSNDSGLFRTREQLEDDGWSLESNNFVRGDERYLPLYEAKMIHHYNHRFGDYAMVKPGESSHELPDVPVHLLQNPEWVPLPRYWVPENEVESRLRGKWDRGWLLGWRDITGSEKSRTVIASVVPRVGVNHKTPLMLLDIETVQHAATALALMSTQVFDYIARQKLGGTSLTYFVLKQLPVLTLSSLSESLPWDTSSCSLSWISTRVVELVCTSHDLAEFAVDMGFDRSTFRWDETRRFLLRCELDAAFFHLYGIERGDVDYIMETFPIVKRKDIAQHGDYRTKLTILDIYDRMNSAIDTGQPYQTLLDLPRADPRVAHEIPLPEIASIPAGPPGTSRDLDPPFVLLAILRANGGQIAVMDLTRAFALWCQPSLLVQMAGTNTLAIANEWSRRVGDRAVPPGTLARTIADLARRDAVELRTDRFGSAVANVTANTPPEDKIHPWYRFEARLALRVASALTREASGILDNSLSDDDRKFVEEA